MWGWNRKILGFLFWFLFIESFCLLVSFHSSVNWIGFANSFINQRFIVMKGEKTSKEIVFHWIRDVIVLYSSIQHIRLLSTKGFLHPKERYKTKFNRIFKKSVFTHFHMFYLLDNPKLIYHQICTIESFFSFSEEGETCWIICYTYFKVFQLCRL